MVPDVRGDTLGQAGQALGAVGLHVGQVTSVIDRTCNNIGTVISQNPGPGAQVAQGTAVNVAIGQKSPPSLQCP